eukprot:122381_1
MATIKHSKMMPKYAVSIQYCGGVTEKCNILVVGFVRSFCENDKNKIFVPVAIIKVVHEYFHQEESWFLSSYYSNKIKLKSSSICYHSKKNCWCSVFGSTVAGINDHSNGIRCWTIKAIGHDGQSTTHIMVGIIEDKPNLLNTHWIGGQIHNMYCYYVEGTNPNLYQYSMKQCNRSFLWNKVGQTITVILDFNNKTLKFKIGYTNIGIDCDIGYTNIDITKKYRLAVSFWGGINEIQFV